MRGKKSYVLQAVLVLEWINVKKAALASGFVPLADPPKAHFCLTTRMAMPAGSVVNVIDWLSWAPVVALNS
jgi:hypothetical protein